ncbi:MAG: diguanylate cyclase [Bdellovibrionales bacterium]|nr:diguanylate cyclase [Bdellovibrionales bacterium]
MLQWLTELGFRHVTVASAPTSAVTFADANPPHILLVGTDAVDVERGTEARETILNIRKISREIQAILYSSAGDGGATRKLAISIGAWDWLGIPEVADGDIVRRAAVEFCLDRACSRLFAQFEVEAWRDRYTEIAQTGVGESEGSRGRLIQAIRAFSLLKDFDAVVSEACRLFSAADHGGAADAVYLRWIPIRNAFVIQQCSGAHAADFSVRKGFGFSPADRSPVREALQNLREFQELRRFLKDVFRIDNYTVLLHGTPDEPVGLFVISGIDASEGVQSEIEAVTHLFDLTWGAFKHFAIVIRWSAWIGERGLPNRKAFQENLEFEFARARRLRHPLSVAVVRAGALGLELGDALGASFDSVLKVVGSSLRRTLRGTDIVARFGKDQFAVIMPHTPVAEAAAVIDRLCRMTERLNLPALELLHVERLSIKATLVEYPGRVRDSDSLMSLLLDLDWGEMQPRVRVIDAPPGFEPEYVTRFGEGPTL